MTGRPGRGLGLVTAASVTAVLVRLCVTATAPAAWTEPFDVFTPRKGHAFPPRVAVDATGNAVFAWIVDGHVVTRSRSPTTGALGPIRDIGGPGAHFAQVAVARNGRTTVAWLRRDGATSRVQARSLSPAGSPGPIHDVSAPGRRVHVRPPQLAVAGDGDVVVAWKVDSGLQARSLPDGRGPGPIVDVLPFRVRSSWQMAVGAGGEAVFVFERGIRIRRPRSNRVYARSLSAAGRLRPIVALSAPGERLLVPSPQVAVAPDGRAVAVWTRGIESYRVRARRLSAAGTPGAITDLSATGSGQPEPGPQVAIDAEADAIVTWTQAMKDGEADVEARVLSANGSLGRRMIVGRRSFARPQVGVTPDGGAVFAWAGDAGVQARRRSATGTLGPIATLSGSDDGVSIPQLAVAADGHATVTWEIGHGLGRTWRARAAADP